MSLPSDNSSSAPAGPALPLVLDYATPSSDPTLAVQRTTFFFESWRAVASGIMETAGATFLLLIAVQYFQASPNVKATIAMGGMPGFLLSPLVVYFVGKTRWTVTQAAATILALAGLSFLVATLWPHLAVFTLASIIGLICLTSSVPLLTQMYQDNYPSKNRGFLFSKTMIIRIITTAIFGYLAGKALDGRLDQFQWLMAVYSLSLFAAAWCVYRCPSQPLDPGESKHPLHSMRFLLEDRTFGMAILSWMLMGFSNLMMLSLRVEYLSSSKYGLQLDPAQVALYVLVIPNIARMLMNPIWGRLFDRMDFFLMRICINLGFAVGILAFFTGTSTLGLVVGGIIFGISNAGGDLAWSLWVTRVAPASRVAEYMSVHTFTTGLRGILAPFAAYWLITSLTPAWLSLIAGVLILASCAVLIPEVGMFKNRHSPRPEVEPEMQDTIK